MLERDVSDSPYVTESVGPTDDRQLLPAVPLPSNRHLKGERMSRSHRRYLVALVGALVLTAACGGSDKQRDTVAKRQALLVAAAGGGAVQPGAAASADQSGAGASSATDPATSGAEVGST